MIHKVAAQNGLAAEIGAKEFTSKTTEKLVDDSYLLDQVDLKKVHLQRSEALESKLNGLVIIFECKDDCHTIMDIAHIKEMMRFTAEAVDDPLWKRTCIRNELNQKVVDGAHCTEEAYRNLTHFVEPMIQDVTDLMI